MGASSDPPLTEARLLTAAGDKVLGRGESIVGMVRGLRVEAGRAQGSVQGQRVYSVELTWDEAHVEARCTCPHAADGTFCKHAVAIGLAVVDQTIPSSSQDAKRTDLDRYLDGLDATQLRQLVRETAAFSDVAMRNLEMRAAMAVGNEAAAADELVAATQQALRSRGFIDYRRSFVVAQEAQELLDELQRHLDAGAADAVRPALLKAVTRLRQVVLYGDDSSGLMGDACQRAAELYARSCREGRPDATKLARWLVKFRADSPGWPDVALADFVDAFDDKALAAYRKGVAALDKKLADADHVSRFDVHRMLLELADHDHDVDRALELLQEGEHPSYGAIVDRLFSAGREREAMAFVDRAVAERRITEGRDNDYWLSSERVARWYLDDGRDEDALAMLRQQFSSRQMMEPYRVLITCAEELGRGEQEREWAWRCAEDGARRLSSADLLVQIALDEGDTERAWAAVDRFGSPYRWAELADASKDTHPVRVLELYRGVVNGLLSQADASAYAEVARTLVTMRKLAVGIDKAGDVDEFIATIREEYKRRPTMMRIMDQAGLDAAQRSSASRPDHREEP